MLRDFFVAAGVISKALILNSYLERLYSFSHMSL